LLSLSEWPEGEDLSDMYALAIPLAFFREWISDAFVEVALMWLVPDPRTSSDAGPNDRLRANRPIGPACILL
jgi:hypothetical protein